MELQNGRQKLGTWIFAPNGQFLCRCMARIHSLVGACYCAHYALKIDGEKSQQCATRARSSVEQCSTPRPWVAPVVAQLEELQRKLRSPAPPAALWIEGGSNRIENP